MKKLTTGESAQYGLYVSTRPLDIRFAGADGESLEGLPDANYVRLPTLAVVAAAPMLGGAFVLAFPLLVILASIVCVARLVAKAVHKSAGEHAYLAQPRWEPMTSYLNRGKDEEGKDGKVAEPGEAAKDDLVDLREVVKARRSSETNEESR